MICRKISKQTVQLLWNKWPLNLIFHETVSRLTYLSSLSFSLIRNVYLTDEILLCVKEESVIAGGHSPGKYSKPYLHASLKVGRSVK
ncbi:hypothetical protein T4D_3742 [Trichinella pseudospiralis]|uniref:Uncharacterized protein n=1 Tax=Trichinella pseudospiralis TaxID=6337 RepID=A0A0V1FA35_TRIPS|nr:hypothetical protein T4D_3742 [Trichinella pseudospiralis]